MAQVWWAWIPFISFVVITGFIVFNLIVAVVCEEAISEITVAQRRRTVVINNDDDDDNDAGKGEGGPVQ